MLPWNPSRFIRRTNEYMHDGGYGKDKMKSAKISLKYRVVIPKMPGVHAKLSPGQSLQMVDTQSYRKLSLIQKSFRQ